MDFRPLDTKERARLRNALMSNGEDSKCVLMDRNTAFKGVSDEVPDNVINAIRSVPCHY